LVFALNADIARLMGEIFSKHQLQKTYIAVVRGVAPEYLLLDYPLTEELDKCTDKNAREPEAKLAISEFFRLAEITLPYRVDKYPESRYSLVKCVPRTGRKHQLRRHLKHISHPIIGDAKHGKGNHNRFFQTTLNTHRLLLAATELTFGHPISGEQLKLIAPLDEVMTQLMQRFNWYNALPAEWLKS
jgi:tRNA pseudouridine65 synthase